MKRTFIDLSHTVEDGVITYKGLPAPIICDFLSRQESRQYYAEGTEFHIGKIEMVANTGTYLDSPFHRFADGDDLSQLKLENLAGLEGVLVHVPPELKVIDSSYFVDLDVQGKAVIVCTGWSKHWKADQYFESHPYITADAATWLKDHSAKLVGIDSLNIDSTADGSRPVHTILLRAGILIVEHMTYLDKLPVDKPFTFYAVPVKVKDFGTFPVRAFAVVEE